MTAIDVDPEDGEPVWAPAPGERLCADAVAWRRLGVGQRCETWLAWSPSIWSPVVVKVLRPHQVALPRGRQAIEREADALARTVHPAVPRLFARRLTDPVPGLVMEYVDGPALADVVDEHGALPPADAVLLAAQLVGAVRTMHRAGLAHLDLKPDNVVLRDGRPYAIDLGSARAVGRTQPAGRPIGSPGYAAPELEAGEPITAASDMYGVGTVLYEALAGRPAFDPELDADARPEPVSLPNPATVPSRLARLTMALLCPRPEQRPGADETLGELAAIASAFGEPPWPVRFDGLLDVPRADPGLVPCDDAEVHPVRTGEPVSTRARVDRHVAGEKDATVAE